MGYSLVIRQLRSKEPLPSSTLFGIVAFLSFGQASKA